jgi:hypothetical protein
MKKNQTGWRMPVTGALLFATAVSAEQSAQTSLNSTNRVSVKLRLGFNISGGFKGVGSTFGPGSPLANPRATPRGDKYNYDDGYALADGSGSKDGLTWYWGYDSTSQINASGANTIDMHRTAATGVRNGSGGDLDTPSVGAEISYNYQLGRKISDNGHELRYGIEGAVNWMPIAFGGSGVYNLTLARTTDTYGYFNGTTPPSATLPYQGSFGGPGFVIQTAHSSVVTPLGSGTLRVNQDFDGNLWGARLGPYLEYPVTDKFSFHLSGGLAVGLLAADASWSETLTQAGGGGTSRVSGHDNDITALWGFYVGLDAQYQINPRWGVELGVQYQDLGTYNHNFGGRTAEVDLNNSIFVHLGINYSF